MEILVYYLPARTSEKKKLHSNRYLEVNLKTCMIWQRKLLILEGNKRTSELRQRYVPLNGKIECHKDVCFPELVYKFKAYQEIYLVCVEE